MERGALNPFWRRRRGGIQQQNSDVQVVFRARVRESFPSFGASLIFTPDSFFLKFSDAVGGKREVGRRKEIFKEEEEGGEGKKLSLLLRGCRGDEERGPSSYSTSPLLFLWDFGIKKLGIPQEKK